MFDRFVICQGKKVTVKIDLDHVGKFLLENPCVTNLTIVDGFFLSLLRKFV